MRKTLISLVLVLGLLVVPLVAQVTFGIGPGVQYSSGRQHPLNLAYDRTYRCTAFPELWVDIPLFWKFSLRPGLAYFKKEFNATVVYSGPEHAMTPGTVRMDVIELPIELIFQPVKFFHLGGGAYVSTALAHAINFTELQQVAVTNLDGTVTYHTDHGRHLGWFKNGHHYGTLKPHCPPLTPGPAPIPLGYANGTVDTFDWGYILTAGLDCRMLGHKNSLGFTFRRGIQKVFQTYGRYCVNETLTASYTLWF